MLNHEFVASLYDKLCDVVDTKEVIHKWKEGFEESNKVSSGKSFKRMLSRTRSIGRGDKSRHEAFTQADKRILQLIW